MSGKLWSCLKEVKPLEVYDVEREMALEPKHGNRASSEFHMGCIETLRITAVTSVSF